MTTPTPGDLSARLRIIACDYPLGSIIRNTLDQTIAALSALPAAGECEKCGDTGITQNDEGRNVFCPCKATTPQPSAAEEGWGPSYKQPWQAKADAAVGAQGDDNDAIPCGQCGSTWPPYLLKNGQCIKCRKATPAAGKGVDDLLDLATLYGDHSVDSRNRESWDFDAHGLKQLAAALTRQPVAGKGVDAVQVREALDALEWAAGSQPTPHAAKYATTVRAALTRQPVAGDGNADFELWQDGECVAGSSGPRAEAWREILHYAAQYEQDGAVTIMEVIRRPLAAPAATPTDGGEGP